MNKKCYEIINCPFNTGKASGNCPVFDLKINCYEYDWSAFYKKLPDTKEKLDWKCGMIENCKLCKIYIKHKSKMDKIFNKF